MDQMSTLGGSQAAPVEAPVSISRKAAGRWIVVLATAALGLTILAQASYATGFTSFGFETWRPVLYAYLGWCVALGAGQVMIRGEAGRRALFLLPALLFTVAMVIFPTFFGIYLAFTDWNLSSPEGPRLNGLANLYARALAPVATAGVGRVRTAARTASRRSSLRQRSDLKRALLLLSSSRL